MGGGITNPLHIAFIAVIALVFLGPKRLPDFARTIANGMREFREAINGESASEPSEPAIEPAPVTMETAPPASAPPPAEQVVIAVNAAPSPSEQELAAPPGQTAA